MIAPFFIMDGLVNFPDARFSALVAVLVSNSFARVLLHPTRNSSGAHTLHKFESRLALFAQKFALQKFPASLRLYRIRKGSNILPS